MFSSNYLSIKKDIEYSTIFQNKEIRLLKTKFKVNLA